MTFHGGIVAVDTAKRLVTLKGPSGELLKLGAEREEDLTARNVGERVLVRYFEGAQIRKERPGGVAPVDSLKDKMLGAEPSGPSGRHRALSASIERIDAANQEITLKERPHGLALSVESEG